MLRSRDIVNGPLVAWRGSAPTPRRRRQVELSVDSLEGRVVTRFVIDRQGVVTAAQDGGSSLANPNVVACVVRSFYSLTFPEHEGGIVTVVYPLALRPE